MDGSPEQLFPCADTCPCGQGSPPAPPEGGDTPSPLSLRVREGKASHTRKRSLCAREPPGKEPVVPASRGGDSRWGPWWPLPVGPRGPSKAGDLAQVEEESLCAAEWRCFWPERSLGDFPVGCWGDYGQAGLGCAGHGGEPGCPRLAPDLGC